MRTLIYSFVSVLMATAAAAAPRVVSSDDVGLIVRGPSTADDWGRPLAAGDFDDDGYDDLIIADALTFGGSTSRLFIIRGGSGQHGFGLLDLASGAFADQVIIGAQVDDNLGASIAVGDVNGDGVDDLLVAASLTDSGGIADRGAVYLIYGNEQFFANSERDLALPGTWNLRILGPVAAGDMGGSSTFGGGDGNAIAIGNLNGDAFGDLVLGVHLAEVGSIGNAGRAYVVLGEAWADGTTLNLALSSDYDVVVNGIGELDELGAVVLTGDITGDNIDELILPTRFWNKGLFTTEGAVFIFRGRTTWSRAFGASGADIWLRGARSYDQLGEAAAVGDFNGDGVGDLAVAATGFDAGPLNTQRGEGAVYGLLGSSTYQSGKFVIDYINTNPDFLFVGEFQENLGTLVAAADFNGDGIDDIAAAERFAGPSINGAIEVLLGRDFAPADTFLAAVDTDIRLIGAPSDRIGFWLTTSNVNGDALPEVYFSSPFNNGGLGTAYAYTYVSADADFDRDSDLSDFAAAQVCVGAPARTLPCVLFDFSLNEVIDAADADKLFEVLVGP